MASSALAARTLAATAVALCLGAGPVTAQSTAGAEVAKGPTRPMGKPFSGRLSPAAARDEAPTTSEGSFGMLYAVLDGTGKLAVNGTFERLASPAATAHFYRGEDGKRGPKVGELTVTKGTQGVIRGNIQMTEGQMADLQKGMYYVQIETTAAPDGQVRGWLIAGMLK